MKSKKGSASPQSYHHGDLQDALIRTARKLLEKEGLEALSLRGVARAAGVSPAAPYHHFADKHALLNAVAVEGFTALRLEMLARMEREESPAARRDACGVGYVLFAVKNPALFQLMFGGYGQPVPADVILEKPRELAYGLLQDAVVESSSDGKASPLTCLRLWALVHGIAKLILESGIKPSDYGVSDNEALAVCLLDRSKLPWP